MNRWRLTGFRRFVVTASVVLSTVILALGGTPLLPTRALAIQDGLIGVEGGVMGDPSRFPGLVGKLRYPTLYFVTLKNETSLPVWAEVQMRLPKKKTKSTFGSVKAGMEGHWRWPSYDVIWNEPIPIQISVYGDEGRANKLAEREMTMYFDGSLKDLLYHPPKAHGGQTSTVLISGWHEMNPSLCKIEGSAADEELRADICLTLWKYESVDHLDCEHRIVGAERLDAAQSTLLAAQPEDFRGRAEVFQAKGDLILEKWSVKSCEVLTPYEVMLIKAPQGGTDILVAPVRPQEESRSPERGSGPARLPGAFRLN